MSLKDSHPRSVPEDTARVARAVFKKGHRYLLLRDTFGDFFDNDDFRTLFHAEGRPAIDPAQLALVTLVQFAENLSDERAADAVRARIDLKYLLALPLDHPGFDASVLSEFRTRLVEGHGEYLLFERLLERFRAQRLLRARGQQRTDSTHVLAAVRSLNRASLVGETFRHALNVLAVAAPEWLVQHSQHEWVKRYASHFDLLTDVAESQRARRDALLVQVGSDGHFLLEAVLAQDAPPWLRELPAIQVLWKVWLQNFTPTETGALRWRTSDEIPPSAAFVGSPYDVEARYSQKRSTSWVGYKVHLTEMCDDDLPMLITNVETSIANTQDFDVLEDVHDHLARKALLPESHFVDMGYLSAGLLVSEKQDHDVKLIGPARHDQRWQAWAGKGFAAEHFKVDWDAQVLTCPAGQVSASWTDALDRRGRAAVKIKFSVTQCRACPVKIDCTTAPRRTVTLQGRERHEALLEWRAWTQTKEFAALYAKRAGIEGTISVGVRVTGMRRSRYCGLEKTRLQHLCTASALNLLRVADHLAGRPRAQTRVTAFARLLAQAA